MRLLKDEYSVSRNLAVKFLSDDIDQSILLCEALRDKFTSPTTGIGGRLDLKRLPGTHITPNTPSLENLYNGSAQPMDEALKDLETMSRAKALELTEQVQVLAETIVKFAQEEFTRDKMMPQARNRIESSST